GPTASRRRAAALSGRSTGTMPRWWDCRLRPWPGFWNSGTSGGRDVPPRVQEKKSLWRRSKKKNGLAPCFFPQKEEKTPILAVARKKGLCYDKATFRRCR